VYNLEVSHKLGRKARRNYISDMKREENLECSLIRISSNN
jgi:hypothetical protein